MADNLERQLEHVVDRDEMHKLIDALEPDQTAILIAQAKCEEHNNGTVTFYHLGHILLWKALGLIEATKMEIQETMYHSSCCFADEEED